MFNAPIPPNRISILVALEGSDERLKLSVQAGYSEISGDHKTRICTLRPGEQIC